MLILVNEINCHEVDFKGCLRTQARIRGSVSIWKEETKIYEPANQEHREAEIDEQGEQTLSSLTLTLSSF